MACKQTFVMSISHVSSVNTDVRELQCCSASQMFFNLAVEVTNKIKVSALIVLKYCQVTLNIEMKPSYLGDLAAIISPKKETWKA